MNPFTSMSDEEFIDRFRLRKDSTHDLIEEIKDDLVATTDSSGCPVPPYLQFLIAMRCMATGDHQRTVADCHDVSQTTVSECLKTVSRAVASRSRNYICPPSGNDQHQCIQAFYDIWGMPGVVGAIDCTHIAILKPSVQNSELFRCRKGFFSINVQGVCGPDLLFHNIVARWPGSVNDSRIFENSRLYADLEYNLNPRYHLLGAAAYALKRFVLTPVSAPRDAHERAYNISHSQTRKVIERAFGVLKRRFGYLGMKMRTDLDTTKAIIVACFVMHNIGVKSKLVLPDDLEDDNQINVPNRMAENVQENEQATRKRQQIIRDHF
ncbi:putative nuclease HARBI1 isoform X2 [Portunus trituberculatus]|nr:putative nuclease HARBI1 isoform X2 [Portunus trituberculatus]